jgi:hypothetical protein
VARGEDDAGEEGGDRTEAFLRVIIVVSHCDNDNLFDNNIITCMPEFFFGLNAHPLQYPVKDRSRIKIRYSIVKAGRRQTNDTIGAILSGKEKMQQKK